MLTPCRQTALNPSAKKERCPDGSLNTLDSCRKKIERECPRYLSDSGTHVGCHLQNISGLSFYSYFLVNGTSQKSGIQFFDSVLMLKEIGENNHLCFNRYLIGLTELFVLKSA